MTNKIVVFGGNVKGLRFVELKEAANRLNINLDLVAYKKMSYRTEDGKILIKEKIMKDYDVYFFRNTKKYWEEVSLILDNIDKNKIVVDPIVRSGRPGDVCKAYQMLVLSQAGLPVPRSIYGSLGYLRKKAVKNFDFPLIIKGSRGDRRKQVFKIYGEKDFNSRIDELKVLEKNGENKYMLQEYIVNTEDFRVMVLGDKVLGVMRRGVGDNPRLKNVFEKTDLSENVKKMAIEAAQKCGILIAGVDVVFKNDDITKPLFFEVNRTPNYTRFVEVTGIDVATEVVKFLANLEK